MRLHTRGRLSRTLRAPSSPPSVVPLTGLAALALLLAGVPASARADTGDGARAAATGTATGAVTLARAVAGPDYEMPFPCGDIWNGSSRYNHSPSALAIDWNRTHDYGAMVVATAPGVVTSTVDLGNRSYGRYVIVDHGGGRSSLYAHLSAFWSTVGQAVDQGTPLGLVGSTGGSTGPHLHLEERLDRRDQHAYFHRRSFTMGTTQASTNCGDVPLAGDWDGDGTSNVAIQRRSTSPTYSLRQPAHRNLRVPFGWRTDQPLSGDWDGDGRAEIGARRPGLMSFVLRNRNGTVTRVRLGRVSDFGVTGDWNGDRRTDLGVWHPATQVFTLRGADGHTRDVPLGSPGDRPVTGDWNGDGRTDLGVWSSRTATFTLRTKTRTGVVSFRRVAFGSPTSLPVTGDWDGDGIGDLGVWNPANAVFALRLSPTRARPSVVVHRRHWGIGRG
jgi:hypothetical protein